MRTWRAGLMDFRAEPTLAALAPVEGQNTAATQQAQSRIGDTKTLIAPGDDHRSGL